MFARAKVPALGQKPTPTHWFDEVRFVPQSDILWGPFAGLRPRGSRCSASLPGLLRRAKETCREWRLRRCSFGGCPSIETGDRTSLRRLTIGQVEEDLIDVAPAPALGRIVAFDDRMLGGVK